MKTNAKILITSLFAVIMLAMMPSKAQAQTKTFDEKFLPKSYVSDAKKPVLVMLTATWCPPCKTMKNHVMKNEEVKKVMEKMNVVFLDVDTEEGKKLAPGFTEAGFENGIPFFCILDTEGKPVKSMIGSTSEGNFLKFLSAAFE
ncbi:MAG: thioredoxin family protein [Bacteroidales bacterium]|nr:thioredoxin family protein [Bacteroidales bacterium]